MRGFLNFSSMGRAARLGILPVMAGVVWLALLAGCVEIPPDSGNAPILDGGATVIFHGGWTGSWPDNYLVNLIVVEGMVVDSISATVSGVAAAESDGGVWSTTDLPDDTFTLRPATQWINGGGLRLDYVFHAAGKPDSDVGLIMVVPGTPSP